MEKMSQMNVRLPANELESIKNKSENAGMSMNAFVRAVLRDAFVQVHIGQQEKQDQANA